VFLRVVRRKAAARPFAAVRGIGLCDEPAARSPDRPNVGAGMAAAMKLALAEAGAHLRDVDTLATDLNGERRRFTELAFARTRLRQRRPDPLPAFCAAQSVGEIGAAIGPLSVAWIAFKLGTGGAPKPAGLYVGGAEQGLRGAVCLLAVDHGG
jgi:3-oxoacyl-[acyl-carrier-protein] synthase I